MSILDLIYGRGIISVNNQLNFNLLALPQTVLREQYLQPTMAQVKEADLQNDVGQRVQQISWLVEGDAPAEQAIDTIVRTLKCRIFSIQSGYSVRKTPPFRNT